MKKIDIITRHCTKINENVVFTCEYAVQERVYNGVKTEAQRKLLHAECEKGRECGAEGSDCEWTIPFPSDKDVKDYPGIR